MAGGWGEEGSPCTPSKREENGLVSAPQRSLRVGPHVPPLNPTIASYVSTVRKLTVDEDEVRLWAGLCCWELQCANHCMSCASFSPALPCVSVQAVGGL